MWMDGEIEDPQTIKAWMEAGCSNDMERLYSDFSDGVWWQTAQEWIGEEFSVGGLLFYSDEVVVGTNVKVYAVYGKQLATACMIIHEH